MPHPLQAKRLRAKLAKPLCFPTTFIDLTFYINPARNRSPRYDLFRPFKPSKDRNTPAAPDYLRKKQKGDLQPPLKAPTSQGTYSGISRDSSKRTMDPNKNEPPALDHWEKGREMSTTRRLGRQRKGDPHLELGGEGVPGGPLRSVVADHPPPARGVALSDGAVAHFDAVRAKGQPACVHLSPRESVGLQAEALHRHLQTRRRAAECRRRVLCCQDSNVGKWETSPEVKEMIVFNLVSSLFPKWHCQWVGQNLFRLNCAHPMRWL